jgi:hypothetical protein
VQAVWSLPIYLNVFSLKLCYFYEMVFSIDCVSLHYREAGVFFLKTRVVIFVLKLFCGRTIQIDNTKLDSYFIYQTCQKVPKISLYYLVSGLTLWF